MEFSLDRGPGTYKIESCDDVNGIKVNGTWYTDSLIVMPEKIVAPWEPNSVDDLTIEHFNTIFSLHPQVVLLGTGSKAQFPNPTLYRILTDNLIGVEVMTNAAACRTYTILMAEGREVLAAFLKVAN